MPGKEYWDFWDAWEKQARKENFERVARIKASLDSLFIPRTCLLLVQEYLFTKCKDCGETCREAPYCETCTIHFQSFCW
jgi:hypothetical protein